MTKLEANMKKLAPIIITGIIVLYLGAYAFVLLVVLPEDMGNGKILLGLIGIIVLGVMVAMLYTLKERLKEIDKEKKDDLSKY